MGADPNLGPAPDSAFAKAARARNGRPWWEAEQAAAKSADLPPKLGTVADFVDGLAKQRAAATGETFEKAYSHILSAGGGVTYAALKAEQAAKV